MAYYGVVEFFFCQVPMNVIYEGVVDAEKHTLRNLLSREKRLFGYKT
jgi:hypothetical protein